jgi:hypothetical protein
MTAAYPIHRTFKFSKLQWQMIGRECQRLGIGLNDYARLCLIGHIGKLKPLPTYNYEFDPDAEGNIKCHGDPSHGVFA